jgi:hypothetical protein
MGSSSTQRTHAAQQPGTTTDDAGAVVVFTTPGCKYCRQAKQALQQLQVPFQVRRAKWGTHAAV